MAALISPREALDRRPLAIGLFYPTLSGGWIVSRAAWEKRRRQTTWPYLSDLARRAEAAGLDYLFLAMQYPPHGGYGQNDVGWRGETFESLSTTGAVLAITHRIFVCATVHILYHQHPIFLAQHAVTLDHIGNGRLGLNIVAGILPREQDLLDVPPLDHDERYVAAEEFLTVMKRAWTEDEPFDFAGKYVRSQRAWVHPKPVQRPYPLLINAGFSDAGKEFAARGHDWAFVTLPNVRDLDSAGPLCAEITARAAAHGRRIRPCTYVQMFCRETDQEAQDYFQWVVDNADEAGVQGWRDQNRAAQRQGLTRDDSAARYARPRGTGEGRLRAMFISGAIVVGSPISVAEQIIRLHRSGLAGLQITFLDFDDLEFFADRVLPLLREAGLR